MRNSSVAADIALMVVALTLFPWRSAFAYIDPGTATWLLQVIVALAISAMFVLKAFWRQVLDFFKGIFRKKRPSQD